MRTLRGVLVGALALSISVVFPAAQASAAPPSAPYNALMLSGKPGTYVVTSGWAFDDSNSTLYRNPSNIGTDHLQLQWTGAGTRSHVTIKAPQGTPFVAGTTYSTTRFGSVTAASLDVSFDSRGCNALAGSMTVHEVARDPETHMVSAFAATFTTGCDQYAEAMAGEVRFNSTIPYKGAASNTESIAFGLAGVGVVGAPKTITFKAMGSEPTTFGTPSFGGQTPAAFVVTGGTCANATFAYGESCTVVVSPSATALGWQYAHLVLPYDGVRGELYLPLSLEGKLAYDLRINPPTPDLGVAVMGVPTPEQTLTAYSWGTEPITFGTPFVAGATPAAFQVTGGTCANATVTRGQNCTVIVRATPTVFGSQTADLVFPDNGGVQRASAPLTVVGLDPKGVTPSTTSIDFGYQEIGVNGTPQTVWVTASATQPVTFGQASITDSMTGWFSITADTCSNVTVAVGQSCSVTVVPHPVLQGSGGAELSLPSNNFTSPLKVHVQATGTIAATGTYYPRAPQRFLDTRSGLGGFAGPVPQQGTVSLQITGVNGVPVSGVSAVALNVTVTEPTANGHIIVYPSGVPRPTASSLNFVPGWTGANSVTVAVGANGKIELFNTAGNTHLIVDVVGYFAKDNSLIPSQGVGRQLYPVEPERLLDTREELGRLYPGEYVQLYLNYGSALNQRMKALVVNVTAVNPSGPGHLITWNGLPESLPTTSTLNFKSSSDIVPNLAIVPVSWAGGYPTIGIYTSQETHIIVDLVGIFADGTIDDPGLRFRPNTPTRITDTRSGLGWPSAIGQGQTATITPPGSIATEDAMALALNVTAVQPTQDTHLIVWPAGGTKPNVSNLNPKQGQIIPNAAITELSAGNQFNVYNNGGSVHVVIDVVGVYYWRQVGAGAIARSAAPTPQLTRITPAGPVIATRQRL